MKVAARIFSLLILASAVIFLSNCKDKDPDPTPEQVQLQKLVGSWTLTSATLDGDDRNEDVNGVLVFEGTYVSEGGTYKYYFSSGELPSPGASPWPKKTSADKGSWKFGTDPNTQIVRLDDDMQISYTMPAENQLTLQFTCSNCTFEGGPIRSKAISGVWIFSLTKN